MSSKEKKKLKFTFASLVRLVVFSLLIYFLISYLSQSNSKTTKIDDPTVLGTETSVDLSQIYDKLPQNSREKLENIDKNPAFVKIQQKFEEIKKQSDGFPQKQIKELEKLLLKSLYDDMINNIEESK